MQSPPIKKSFFQHTKISISHRTKANEQLQISSATTYCELAVHLFIFEKEKVYCKLTVSCRGWNVWLLVSFGVVRSRCRCALKKVFSLSDSLVWAENASFFANQKPCFCTNLSLFPSKATLFHPPLPISTSLNLLFAKNTAVLLLFALILCCKAGASHRFKSLPAIPDEVAASCKTGYLMKAGHFRKNTVSTGDLNRPRSPEVRKPLACFLVLFAQCKKNKPVSFSGTSEVLQTSIQPTAVTSSHRNN